MREDDFPPSSLWRQPCPPRDTLASPPASQRGTRAAGTAETQRLREPKGRECRGVTAEEAGNSNPVVLAVRNQGGLLHMLLEGDAAFPAYIGFFNNAVL